MPSREQRNTLPVKNVDVHKMFHDWGWTILVGGTNHIRYRKNETTVSVRKGANSGSATTTWEPVKKAAKEDGVTIEQWMKGPQKKKEDSPEEVFSHEMDYFIQTPDWKVNRFTDVEKEFLRIKAKLRQRDMLRQTETTRYKYQRDNPTEAPALEPLPLKTDSEGYITLDEALQLRNLKQGKLSNTSCELLSVLTLGTVEHKDGLATRALLEKMFHAPKSLGGVTMLVKDWEKAGIIWREVKGKRCYKIGLTIPIKLTDEELVKYLKPLEKTEQAEQAEPGAPKEGFRKYTPKNPTPPDDWSTTEGGITDKETSSFGGYEFPPTPSNEELEVMLEGRKRLQSQQRGDALAVVMASEETTNSVLRAVGAITDLPPVLQELVKLLPKEGDSWTLVDQKRWLACIEFAFPLVYKQGAEE